jgi:hypothetical protein
MEPESLEFVIPVTLIPKSLVEEEERITVDDTLSQEQRFQRWQSKRPPIDHLIDAIAATSEGLVPLFDIGDRIVVDCRTDLLQGTPWLETIVGKVRTIDDETGLVTINDEDSDYKLPKVRYVSFKRALYTFRLAPTKGNPFEPPAPPKPEKPQRMPGQKGRGRPRGSKNRPKEVIQAERSARKAAKGK